MLGVFACVCMCVCLIHVFQHLSSVESYVLQYLGNRLNLAPFVTQSLVQVCSVYVVG